MSSCSQPSCRQMSMNRCTETARATVDSAALSPAALAEARSPAALSPAALVEERSRCKKDRQPHSLKCGHIAIAELAKPVEMPCLRCDTHRNRYNTSFRQGVCPHCAVACCCCGMRGGHTRVQAKAARQAQPWRRAPRAPLGSGRRADMCLWQLCRICGQIVAALPTNCACRCWWDTSGLYAGGCNVVAAPTNGGHARSRPACGRPPSRWYLGDIPGTHLCYSSGPACTCMQQNGNCCISFV